MLRYLFKGLYCSGIGPPLGMSKIKGIAAKSFEKRFDIKQPAATGARQFSNRTHL